MVWKLVSVEHAVGDRDAAATFVCHSGVQAARLPIAIRATVRVEASVCPPNPANTMPFGTTQEREGVRTAVVTRQSGVARLPVPPLQLVLPVAAKAYSLSPPT